MEGKKPSSPGRVMTKGEKLPGSYANKLLALGEGQARGKSLRTGG